MSQTVVCLTNPLSITINHFTAGPLHWTLSLLLHSPNVVVFNRLHYTLAMTDLANVKTNNSICPRYHCHLSEKNTHTQYRSRFLPRFPFFIVDALLHISHLLYILLHIITLNFSFYVRSSLFPRGLSF